MTMLVNANALHIPLADKSVNMVVTSPPYWGLRDYGTSDQLGLEQTPEEYVANMVAVFRDVWRVLRDDGTVWLNLGDSYAGGSKDPNPNGKQGTNRGTVAFDPGILRGFVPSGLKPKDLVGIPWRVAFALQADGWYLRSDIIWSKPNPMPESVTDRPTKAHEYLFLLSKSQRYYYDADAVREEPTARYSDNKLLTWNERVSLNHYSATPEWNNPSKPYRKGTGDSFQMMPNPAGRNRRTVWTSRGNWRQEFCPESEDDGICEPDCKLCGGSGLVWVNFQRDTTGGSLWQIATAPYSGAHFATFPPTLVEPCIKAGSKPGGIVFDPFAGSGTTLVVARKLGRHGIGLDLSMRYLVENARTRLELDKLEDWSGGISDDSDLSSLPLFAVKTA